MTDSFFGFNNTLSGFEDGLNDDPGQGLEEEAEEYDALNDETFGADSLEGDWEQDHEKLAQITEQSRIHRSSYNSATEERADVQELEVEEVEVYEEDDDDAGFQDLNLEASLSQLVTDDDDMLVENKKPKTHRSIGAGVLEGGYSCSPPSQVNVWGVQRQDQQALKPRNVQPVKKVCTVEELERTLKQNSMMTPHQKRLPAAVRLEDLERDLTANKQKVTAPPPGFVRPLYPHGHQEPIRNGVPPGFGQHQPRNMPIRGPFPPQMLIPPPGLEFRHRPIVPGPGPNMFRFVPPHMMMAAQQHYQQQQHRPNFRQPYPQNTMGRGGPRGPVGPRFPGHRPPRENGEPRDEYDGLMTEREVQWLLNIQQININTAQPYIDDFYFTVYSARHPKLNHTDRRRTRERRDSHRTEQPPIPQQGRVYTPLQFENSLGKLQCGSVTAPRKIIDMDVVSNEVHDPSVAHTSQRDTRKAKQLLLTIEQLYLVLLKLEDLDNPMAAAAMAAGAMAVGAEQPSDVVKPEDRTSLVQQLTSGLSAEGRLQSVLCVRKGKELVTRLLPHVSPEGHGEWLAGLWCTVLRGLIPIARRDAEPASLPKLFPHFRRWLDGADVPALERAARSLKTAPPARNTLAYALGNKFGLSACCALVNRGDCLPEVAESGDWRLFLQDLVEAVSSEAAPPAPVEPLDPATLGRHLARAGVIAPPERLAPLMRALAPVAS